MVSFCCDGCNETLKKQKVARHNCGSNSVSCIDCSVTFYGDDYVKHTSCISEAQKYEKTLYREKKSKLPPVKRQLPEVGSDEPANKRASKGNGESNVTEAKSGDARHHGSSDDALRKDTTQQEKSNGRKFKAIDTASKDTKPAAGKMQSNKKEKCSEERPGLTASPGKDVDQINEKDALKKMITEVLGEPGSNPSLGHVRKMTKKRGRGVGLHFTDDMFYSCLKEMGSRVGLTLIK